MNPVKGYIMISREAVKPDELGLFNQLRGSVSVVYEHRFVMSRVLGRALRSNELVDHMDGVKTNNDPSNLRIYIRGRNMPGETTGYGTYYHEWQTALARVRELEQLLAGKQQTLSATTVSYPLVSNNPSPMRAAAVGAAAGAGSQVTSAGSQ